MLNNYYNVSISKTRQCISDVTKGIVNLSTGAICNLSSEFSSATEADRAKIFSLLTHSDILYSDATVSNINGSRKAVILCTNKEQVLYQHLEHKGHDGLSQTPVKNFDGTLLQKMIHTAKRNKSGIPKDKVSALTKKYESILTIAAEEYQKAPPDKEYMDGYNLWKRLKDFQQAHLYFLSHPDIDYTNNISERGLRKFKRKQKQAVVLRSTSGGQRICNALTIIETARMQHKNVYDVVETAFEK